MTSKHAAADGRLDRHLEHLLRNDVFQLFAQHAPAVVRLVFVHDERQGINRLAGKQNVEFLQRARLIFVELIVEACVALRAALQLIEIVENELTRGNLPNLLHRRGRNVVHGLERAAVRHGKLHDRAHVIGRNHDRRTQIRLFDMVDFRRIGHILRRMHAHHFFIGPVHVVFNARRGSDKVEAEFSLEALLDDLHMQKAQESHAEAEAQRVAVLHLPFKGGVVQRQLLEGLFERLELVAFDGEQARIYHGLRLAVARQGFGHSADPRGDGIAHANLGNVLQARDQVPDFAHRKVWKRNLFWMARTNFFHKNLGAGVHEAHLVALLDGAVDHANKRDHTAIRIEIRVEDKRAQRAISVAFGRRNKVHYSLKQVFHADARFAARQNRVIGNDCQAIFNLALHALGLG